MSERKNKYIFGPVYSWRLGVSLGIDPISCALVDNKSGKEGSRKICNFDCVYCQLGRTEKFFSERGKYVPVEDIVEELIALPQDVIDDIDYYTFSGAGEPSLASNLGEMINAVRKIIGRAKIAVITNSSLLGYVDVRADLCFADYVLAKLDVCNQDLLEEINHPARGVRFGSIIEGIRLFKKEFSGKLALQIMFIEQNKRYAKDIADIAKSINPDEIQLNTPLRPSSVSPLTCDQMELIKSCFDGIRVTSVYDLKIKKKINPLDISNTVQRHGFYYVKD